MGNLDSYFLPNLKSTKSTLTASNTVIFTNYLIKHRYTTFLFVQKTFDVVKQSNTKLAVIMFLRYFSNASILEIFDIMGLEEDDIMFVEEDEIVGRGRFLSFPLM